MLNRLPPTSTLNAAADAQSFDLWEIISFAWREWQFIATVVAMTFLVGTVYVLKRNATLYSFCRYPARAGESKSPK